MKERSLKSSDYSFILHPSSFILAVLARAARIVYTRAKVRLPRIEFSFFSTAGRGVFGATLWREGSTPRRIIFRFVSLRFVETVTWLRRE
jgi:hypothetical protein